MEYGGGRLTTLIHDLIGTWLGPTHLCFFPNEINKNGMLKEVQTGGIFLRKLGLPDKRDIPMYSTIAGLFKVLSLFESLKPDADC
jgi:hypothetical protein